MPYRSDLDALLSREDALVQESAKIGELAERKAKGVVMPVRYLGGLLPDTLGAEPNVMLLVEGELHADGTFLATQVLAKVPSGTR